MNKRTKGWLIAAACLTALGLILFGAVMTAYGWDFDKLNTVEHRTRTHFITQAFRNIHLETDTAGILLLPSEDGMCKVICFDEEENNPYLVEVQGDTLSIREKEKWPIHWGISTKKPQIQLYLPKSEYASLFIRESTGDIELSNSLRFETVDISLSTGDVKVFSSVSQVMTVKTSTGDITAEDITAGSLDLTVTTGSVTLSRMTCEGQVSIHVSTGRARLSDLECQSLRSDGSTGYLALKNVLATEQIHVERSTGDVTFDSCDAPHIFVETNTGDVTGSLRSRKIFSTQTNTGDVDVPMSFNGTEYCTIITNTGDIEITVPNIT